MLTLGVNDEVLQTPQRNKRAPAAIRLIAQTAAVDPAQVASQVATLNPNDTIPLRQEARILDHAAHTLETRDARAKHQAPFLDNLTAFAAQEFFWVCEDGQFTAPSSTINSKSCRGSQDHSYCTFLPKSNRKSVTIRAGHKGKDSLHQNVRCIVHETALRARQPIGATNRGDNSAHVPHLSVTYNLMVYFQYREDTILASDALKKYLGVPSGGPTATQVASVQTIYQAATAEDQLRAKVRSAFSLFVENDAAEDIVQAVVGFHVPAEHNAIVASV